jgi:hypothetical protein
MCGSCERTGQVATEEEIHQTGNTEARNHATPFEPAERDCRQDDCHASDHLAVRQSDAEADVDVVGVDEQVRRCRNRQNQCEDREPAARDAGASRVRKPDQQTHNADVQDRVLADGPRPPKGIGEMIRGSEQCQSGDNPPT